MHAGRSGTLGHWVLRPWKPAADSRRLPAMHSRPRMPPCHQSESSDLASSLKPKLSITLLTIQLLTIDYVHRRGFLQLLLVLPFFFFSFFLSFFNFRGLDLRRLLVILLFI